MRGFAIIDDQSSLTILDPSAVELMGLPSEILATGNLSTTTVQGTSAPERCITVSGLRVASVNQVGDKIDLPSTYLHKSFENLHHEVPTKSQVAEMPGMEHLAEGFLQDFADLKTVLLIGRNCIAAQKQKQFTSPRNRNQIASETPLGWCIMGQSPPRPTQNTGERPKEPYNGRQPVPQNRNRPTSKAPVFCAWCRDNNRVATHPTKHCGRFNNASIADRWDALKRQEICSLCLIGKHSLQRCPDFNVNQSKCQDCRRSHSSLIGCDEFAEEI